MISYGLVTYIDSLSTRLVTLTLSVLLKEFHIPGSSGATLTVGISAPDASTPTVTPKFFLVLEEDDEKKSCSASIEKEPTAEELLREL